MQELRKNMSQTLKQFYLQQEQMEKLAFDALNVSDMILNSAKKIEVCLEEKEKEKAILEAKDCLNVMFEQIAKLSETVHNSEAAFDKQQDNAETILEAVDFLCCDWDWDS